MPQQAFLKGIRAYWKALGQPGEPPELGESRIDAFIDLLHMTSDAEHAFRLLKVLDSPYAGMAVGDQTRPWRLHWAIQVGEVEPFVAPGLEGGFDRFHLVLKENEVCDDNVGLGD